MRRAASCARKAVATPTSSMLTRPALSLRLVEQGLEFRKSGWMEGDHSLTVSAYVQRSRRCGHAKVSLHAALCGWSWLQLHRFVRMLRTRRKRPRRRRAAECSQYRQIESTSLVLRLTTKLELGGLLNVLRACRFFAPFSGEEKRGLKPAKTQRSGSQQSRLSLGRPFGGAQWTKGPPSVTPISFCRVAGLTVASHRAVWPAAPCEPCAALDAAPSQPSGR